MRLISLLVILIVFKSDIITAQSNPVETDSLLLWHTDRKLTWKDFKGQPDNRAINKGAITQGEITVTNTHWDKDIPKYDIRCYFIKYNSWNTVTDSLSLIHEQVHFDIFELYARKIRKAFYNLNKKGVIDHNVYNNSFQSYFKECSELQKQYDIDYFDKSTQQKWIDKISKELEEFKEYEYIPEEG